MSAYDEQDWGRSYLLDLHETTMRLDCGYWWTIRVYDVERSIGRPYGLKYAITLHDTQDDRVLGIDNAHVVKVGSGPSSKSRTPDAFDHIDQRDKPSRPYTFTTPEALLVDFFELMDEYLKKEGLL